MKLIATGSNGYLNAEYILSVTVVEQADNFTVKVDFYGGAHATIGTFATRDEAIECMDEFADNFNEENNHENYKPFSRFS